MVHIHNGILLTHKKEQNNAICSNIDGTRDSHTKWNVRKIKTNTIWYHLYLESIYGTNEPFHRKENHKHGEQTCGYQRGGGVNEMDWEIQVNRC